MVTGQAASNDGGIPNGDVLLCYAEAIMDRSLDVVNARLACIEVLGDEATAQAASVVASFDGINRVADATGIRIDPETAQGGGAEIVQELGFEDLGVART